MWQLACVPASRSTSCNVLLSSRYGTRQGVLFVEIRRCVYGHELEGYKHANEHGDLEMVGGSREEREGILGSYGARVGKMSAWVSDDIPSVRASDEHASSWLVIKLLTSAPRWLVMEVSVQKR